MELIVAITILAILTGAAIPLAQVRIKRDKERELRRALHRPWSPPVPEFAARIGSWLMGTEASLALVSERCVPKRFLENGFNFEFPTLRQSLTNIFPSQ